MKKNNFTSFILSFLIFCFYFNLHAFTFLVNSDTHVGNDNHSNYILKKAQLPKMLEVIDDFNDVSLVVLAGDLTDTGHDWQFQQFSNEWLIPLVNAGVNIFLAHGNHDTYLDHWYEKKAVLDYIKKTYGNLHYSFNIEGVHFVCCGKYPEGTKSSSCCLPSCKKTWLKKDLEKVGKMTPIVIFFHYNIVGNFSDWWTQEEKDEFYDTIEDYNILCVFTGHWHYTFTHMWREQIPVACVGGSYFAVADYEGAGLTVGFQDKYGDVKTWNQLLRNDYQEKISRNFQDDQINQLDYDITNTTLTQDLKVTVTA